MSTRRRPTVAELEAILEQDGQHAIEILPSGEIQTVPNTICIGCERELPWHELYRCWDCVASSGLHVDGYRLARRAA